LADRVLRQGEPGKTVRPQKSSHASTSAGAKTTMSNRAVRVMKVITKNHHGFIRTTPASTDTTMNGGRLAKELSATRPIPQTGRFSACCRQRAARSTHLPGVAARRRSHGVESEPRPT